MDKCREAFEQIPEIKKRLFYVSFDDKSQNYHPKRYSLDFGFLRLNFVQGAWLVWQSRQAELDQQKLLTRDSELHLDAAKEEIERLKGVVDEKDKRIEAALFQIRQKALSLKEDCDGYKDPVGICQSEGIDWCVRFLEKALRGNNANS